MECLGKVQGHQIKVTPGFDMLWVCGGRLYCRKRIAGLSRDLISSKVLERVKLYGVVAQLNDFRLVRLPGVYSKRAVVVKVFVSNILGPFHPC